VFEYTPDHQLKHVSLPDGRSIDNTYGADGKLVSVISTTRRDDVHLQPCDRRATKPLSSHRRHAKLWLRRATAKHGNVER
jgi:hypothetical protein